MRLFRNVLVFGLIIFVGAVNLYSKKIEEKITVIYNNNMTTANLTLINGMGYLRARDVAKFYNAELSWYQVSKKIAFDFGTTTAVFFANKKNVILSGVRKSLNKKSYIVGQEFYIPLEALLTSAFAHTSGYKARWSYKDKVLRIYKKGSKPKINTVPQKIVSKTGKIKKHVKVTRKDIKIDAGIEKSTQGIISGVNILKSTRVITNLKAKEKMKPLIAKDEIDLIVVDPGHGGKDPGAVAKNGIKEKDLNLEVSKKVVEILKKKYGKKVILTRDDDRFIALGDRTKIANEKGADLFISIHANAYMNTINRGFEIYFLSEIASDAEAENVAKFENAVIKFEDKPADDINTILWSMAINEFMNESSELCYFMQDSVVNKLKNYPSRGVKQAGFRVLKGAKMPAVLVEMGYMTNLKDLGLLCSDTFQNKMAGIIADGVMRYEKYLKND